MNSKLENKVNNIEENFISYNGVELPQAKSRDTSPKIESFSDYIEDDFSKKMQEMIATAWLLDEPVLLEGGTSLGKTTTVKKMCAELGYEVCYVNLSGGTDNLDLIGKYGPNPNLGVNGDERKLIFLDGPVTTALRKEDGKIKVLLLDEYNSARPDAVIRLHEVLDSYKRNGEVVLTEDGAEHVQVNKENIKIIALTNPAGHGYLDRNPLDPAQLRRWAYKKLPNELPKETLITSVDFLFGFKVEEEIKTKESTTKSLRSKLPESELANISGMKEILNQYIAFHETAKGLITNKSIGKDQPQKFTFDDREEPRRVRDYISRFYRGDITETIQEALRYVYADKLLSQQDKQKLEEIIRKITYTPKTNEKRIPLGGSVPKKESRQNEQIDKTKLQEALKNLGSKAELDENIESGIISLEIDNKTLENLKDWSSAKQAYKEADGSSPSYIWDEWDNITYEKPKNIHLDIVVLNHGETKPKERDKLVKDMDKIGYRPLEFSELVALGIIKPELNKIDNNYLVTYKKFSLDCDSHVPVLSWGGDRRRLVRSGSSFGWHDGSRALFARK